MTDSIIGNALSFDNLTSKKVNLQAMFVGPQGHVEFLTKPSWNSGNGNNYAFLECGSFSGNPALRMEHWSNQWYMGWQNNPPDHRVIVDPSNAPVSPGNWYHFSLGWTEGGSSDFYYNGGSVGTRANIVTSMPQQDCRLGSAAHAGSLSVMDEVRFSKFARSAAWVQFQWANINEADHELVFGSEESNYNTINLRWV